MVMAKNSIPQLPAQIAFGDLQTSRPMLYFIVRIHQNMRVPFMDFGSEILFEHFNPRWAKVVPACLVKAA